MSYEGCGGRGWLWDPEDDGSGAQVYCRCLTGANLKAKERREAIELEAEILHVYLSRPQLSSAAYAESRRGWETRLVEIDAELEKL